MLIAAITMTVLYLRYRKSLGHVGATGGILMILFSFWTITLYYAANAGSIIALPNDIVYFSTIQSLLALNYSFIWETGLLVTILTTLGIAFSLKAFWVQNQQLEKAKMEAEYYNQQKSNFLASMSHELRTPLNAIIGFAEFMQHLSDDAQKDRIDEYAGIIVDSGNLLKGLIDDLLDVSKIEEGMRELNLEQLSLADLVTQAVEMEGDAAKRAGVSLSFDVPPLMPTMSGDRRALKQVLLNLLSNAIKFTPKAGEVVVSVKPASNGGAEISVSDNGIGIDGELQKRLFKPFVHGDAYIANREISHGLGLSICKKLVELHGGRIEVKSSVGEGSRFTIFLPEIPERNDPLAKNSPAPQATPIQELVAA